MGGNEGVDKLFNYVFGEHWFDLFGTASDLSITGLNKTPNVLIEVVVTDQKQFLAECFVLVVSGQS